MTWPEAFAHAAEAAGLVVVVVAGLFAMAVYETGRWPWQR